MSGHSKWHSIKHKKALIDAKRGGIFTKHAKLIAVAARRGGDPIMNSSLRLAIDKAKADNMPNTNIERAIKRGTGEDKAGIQIEEVYYEGYGPGGIAVYIYALTDNKNRTVADIRYIFSKNGGNLGESGCVAWMFEKKGVIYLSQVINKDRVEMTAIEGGAEDIIEDKCDLEIITSFTDLEKVRKTLLENKINIDKADIEMRPKETIKITDIETAKKILKLMDALEENEDVNEIASNFDIEESLMK